MSIGSLTQNITPLDEVVAGETNYYQNIANRNNALVVTSFVEINSLTTELNVMIPEINTAVNQVNFDANRADISATSAEEDAQIALDAKEAIEQYVIPIEARYSDSVVDAKVKRVRVLTLSKAIL